VLTLRIAVLLDFVHCSELKTLGNTTFRKLVLSPSCDEVGRHSVVSQKELTSVTGMSVSTHLKGETDLVPETLCFLIFSIPEGGQTQQPRNSEGHAPSSESYTLYLRVKLKNYSALGRE
jgi:hypothetical protein